jgi:hypothetical protein
MHAEFKLLRDQLLVFEFAIGNFYAICTNDLLCVSLILQLSECALRSTCYSYVDFRIISFTSDLLLYLITVIHNSAVSIWPHTNVL